jgi:aminoglycoside phosphotransferase (APT) family kinase protein
VGCAAPEVRSSLPASSVVARHCATAWPGPRIQRFRAIEEGWAHLLLEGDGRWMFRVPRRIELARRLGREVALLDYLGHRIRARVPEPILVGTLPRPRGWPFFVYARLPGVPLRDPGALPPGERRRLAAYLVALFEDLAACPPGPLARIGVPRLDRDATVLRFRRLRRRYRARAARHVPHELDRAIEASFADLIRVLGVSRFRPRLVHGDLWPSHLLWDRRRGAPTGVVDWEDATLGDGAADLVAFESVATELGAEIARRRTLAPDRHFEERLAFYRDVVPVHGLVFGWEQGNLRLATAHRRELEARLLGRGRLTTRPEDPAGRAAARSR